jgi:hypothetical protein
MDDKVNYVAQRVRLMRGYQGDWEDLADQDRGYWLKLAQDHIDCITDFNIFNGLESL